MMILKYNFYLKSFMALVCLGIFCLFSLAATVTPSVSPDKKSTEEFKENPNAPYTAMTLFVKVMEIAKRSYVDPEKASYRKLMEGALKGMLNELDPYSTFESPEKYKDTVETTKGSFGGIGVVVTNKNKMLEVISTMEDGPGGKTGLKAGDVITEIDGVSTRKMSLHDSVKLLKGDPGTEVVVKVYRKTDDTSKTFKITRDIIKISPVKTARINGDSIGYIKISEFSAPTATELDKAIQEFRKDDIKSIVLDLRGNPGGLLASAIEVCSRFLDRDKIVVSVQGRNKKVLKQFKSLPYENPLKLPMTVLINGNSASASEIVAGCLKDHRRAVLVGETTFGKASVQTIIPVENQGAVRITTGKYYTPNGTLIHEEGVKPDIAVPVSPNTALKLSYQGSRYPGVIKPHEDGAVKDVQLERAIEILKGISIFSEAKNGD